MCGIGAFQLKCGDGDARRLAQNLLRGLQSRGTDASGIAWHDDNEPVTYIQKHNCAGGMMAGYLDKNIGRTAIIHTRYATLGSPKNNDNNHPIDVNGVVGVHNGHITNHNELFKKVHEYKRKGQVDSESIFAYLRYGPKNRSLEQKLSDIQGGAAIMWLQTNSDKRYLHVARLTSSPLCYGRTKAGSVIVASTQDILEKAVSKSGMALETVTSLDEGVYLRFQNAELTRTLDIPDSRPKRLWTTNLPYQPSFITRGEGRDIGVATGGEYRDGQWVTRLDLMMEQWERDERQARDER